MARLHEEGRHTAGPAHPRSSRPEQRESLRHPVQGAVARRPFRYRAPSTPDPWVVGAPELLSGSLLNEGELGAIGVHEIPRPKPPLLHSNRVQTRYPGNDAGDPGSADGVVQVVDIDDPQAAREVGRQRVEAGEWEELQLQVTSGGDWRVALGGIAGPLRATRQGSSTPRRETFARNRSRRRTLTWRQSFETEGSEQRGRA
jgi:hypothetical protein